LCLSLSACAGNVGQSASSAASDASGTPAVEAPANPVNPITGTSVDSAKAVLRPFAISVNNKQAAWPQRGTDSADAVIEMLTENTNTHLLLVYGDYTAIPEIGPVTELCDAQAQFAMGINAITAHIGATVYAENLLNQYSYMTLDGKYLGKTAFEFNEARAAVSNNEYSRFTNGGYIAAAIEAKQIPTTASPVKLLDFIEPNSKEITLTEGDAPDVGFNFSDANYTQLTYNADTGLYQKQQFGAPQTDELTGAQLAYKNVIVLSATTLLKADTTSIDYTLTSGTGYYICGGKYESITWTKASPDANFVLKDAKGGAVEVNVGKTYIAVLSTDRAAQLRMDVNAPVEVASSVAAPTA
jgi:hypothetical protein